jgi:Tfp pilus assembly PilM family ATPase
MFGMLFKRNHARAIGCSLSENCVRLAQLEGAHTAEPRLRTAMHPLPRLEPAQPQPWQEAVHEALQTLLAQHRFQGSEVVLCLPASMMGYRRLRLSMIPDTELASAVHWRVARELAVSVKDLQSGYFDVGQLEDAGKPCRDVIAVTAATTDIKPILQIFTSLDMHVQAIDAAASALTRVLAMNLPPAPSLMIVEVGVTSSAIMVARRGVPCFIRTIPGGRRQIVERAAARLGLDATGQVSLWNILDNENASSTADDTTLHTLCEVAMLHAVELAHEVKLCSHYMLSLDAGSLLPQLGCIVGAGPQEDIFMSRIKEACEMDILPLDSAVAAPLRRAIEQHANEGSLDTWLTAIGLALYDQPTRTLEVAV